MTSLNGTLLQGVLAPSPLTGEGWGEGVRHFSLAPHVKSPPSPARKKGAKNLFNTILHSLLNLMNSLLKLTRTPSIGIEHRLMVGAGLPAKASACGFSRASPLLQFNIYSCRINNIAFFHVGANSFAPTSLFKHSDIPIFTAGEWLKHAQ